MSNGSGAEFCIALTEVIAIYYLYVFNASTPCRTRPERW